MAKKKTESTTMKSYVIPLRKEFLKVPKVRRAKKAIRAIKEFLVRHTKTETIKIGPNLNKNVWKDGIQNPPSKVKVDVQKEKDILYAELTGFKIELPKEKQKKKETPSGLAGKVGKLLQDKQGKKGETKEEEKKEEKKKEKKESKEDKENKEEQVKEKEDKENKESKRNKESKENKEEKIKDKEEELKEERGKKKEKTEQEKVLTKKDNSSMY